jgi:hypothetical protein
LIFGVNPSKNRVLHCIDLLLRNLHDVFGAVDPERRRKAIDDIFHEDAAFHEPNGIYRGHDEIDRIAGVINFPRPR